MPSSSVISLSWANVGRWTVIFTILSVSEASLKDAAVGCVGLFTAVGTFCEGSGALGGVASDVRVDSRCFFDPPKPEKPCKRSLPCPEIRSTSPAKLPFSIILMRCDSSVMNSIFCSTRTMVTPFFRFNVLRISPISSTIEG